MKEAQVSCRSCFEDNKIHCRFLVFQIYRILCVISGHFYGNLVHVCISTMSNRWQTNVWIFKQHYLYKSNGFPSQWTQRTPSCFLSGTKNKEEKNRKSGYPQIINRWLGRPFIKDIWFGDVGLLSPWNVWFAGQVATSWDPLLHDIVGHKPTRTAWGNEVLYQQNGGSPNWWTPKSNQMQVVLIFPWYISVHFVDKIYITKKHVDNG